MPNLRHAAANDARKPEHAPSRAVKWRVSIAIAAVLVIGVTLLGWHHFAPGSNHGGVLPAPSDDSANGRTPHAINTVAVLPFVNTGGDAKDEYFSDGMTDELAHALSRLPSLRVAGRTSSYAFKGKDVPAQQIGRTLNVGGVVEGALRRAGDRLRLTRN